MNRKKVIELKENGQLASITNVKNKSKFIGQNGNLYKAREGVYVYLNKWIKII